MRRTTPFTRFLIVALLGIAAANRAEAQAVAIVPPVKEVITFDLRDPGAAGYRFPVTRGRRVTIIAKYRRYFADVLRFAKDSTNFRSRL